ncbi:TlpA family protein disulfide reductase [Pedobacter sp. 22163]|uniref:TlpA family protein disulfide reductase n=1 Tax=Pedobacter sp. 22163 TaxID=3453883 RepID=UPI003F8706AF
MVTKLKLSIIVFILGWCNAYAQEPLQIGDKLPDLEVKTYNGKKMKLSDLYRKAPLIIDFWATWCVPCIKEIRYMDSLSQKQPGKYHAILVTNQTKAVISEYMKRPANSDFVTISERIIPEDTLLGKMFPHRGIPHNIWIDQSGTVRAITSGEEISEKNLLTFGRDPAALAVRTKKDNFRFRPEETFHLADSIYTYRSILSPFIPGIPYGERSPERGNMKEYTQFNQSITRALWGAYSRFNPGIRPIMLDLHTSDSSRFFGPKTRDASFYQKYPYQDRGEWERKNLFCYSLTLPNTVPDSLFASYIYSDIERMFMIKTKIVRKKIPCIVVSKIKGEKLPAATNRKLEPKFSFTADHKLVIRNANLPELLDFLFRRLPPSTLPYPFIDRTASSEQRFDMDLDYSKAPELASNGLKPEMLFQELAKYGYTFKVQNEFFSVLQILDLRK